jgi:hypothetical protein
MAAAHTAISARLGTKMPVVYVVKECILARICNYVDTTTPAAITAVRTTKRDKLFAPKVHGTVATGASAHKDFYLITKPWHLTTLLAAH